MNPQKIILDIAPVLNAEIGSSQSLTIRCRIKDIDSNISLSDDITGNVTVEHIGINRLLLIFNLKTVLEMTCARCLNKFKTPLSLNYEQEYSQKDNDFTILNNKTIDILPSIRQEILLSVPIKPICSASCKGIVVKQK
jgi:uncharacterized protein